VTVLKRLIHYYTEGIPSRKDLMPETSGLIAYLRIIFESMPAGLHRLMKLQPVFALGTSLFCIFMLKRGFEYIPVVIVSLIFAFFCITSRLYLMKNPGKKILNVLWDTALLFLLNNMLLFVLPFYMESMTLPSRNMLFAPIIVGLTVISGWYSLYKRWIIKYPLWSSLFYALTFFCVLNFLFPILFGMRNKWSLLTSGVISSLAVLLFVYPHIDVLKNKKNTIIFLLGTVFLFAFLWLGRGIIPPAPLKLMRTTACLAIEDYRPRDSFAVIDGKAAQEIYFYTSIFAPRGLSEGIQHVWYHNNRKLFIVSLKEIHGGRANGFGTWSRHAVREGPGTYRIEVWTAGGQLLGTGGFVVM
jgi:hypothetical protein